MLGTRLSGLGPGKGCAAVLSAANEVAVQFFLDGGLSFQKIPALIEEALSAISTTAKTSTLTVDGILEIDFRTRQWCLEHLKRRRKVPA